MKFDLLRNNRYRRSLAAAATVVLLASNESQSLWAAPPAAEDALRLRPVQADVSYQKPAAEDVARCKVVDVKDDSGTGWVVETADGLRLRRFVDTDGDKKVDLWCYYDQGFEVYRDIDADKNGKADQYRWLGTAGTRWGLDEDEDGKIDRWRQISAEEVTSEAIAALASADVGRFNRLLATSAELKSIGLGEALQSRLSKKIEAARTGFETVAKGEGGLAESARWVQFASSAPGIVPQGTDGATKDIRVYENAVAMYDDDKKGGQVLVGTIVQVGEAWRLIDVPQIVAENQPLAQYPGVFFSASVNANSLAMSRGASNGDSQELVASLEAIDRELASASKPEAKAELNGRRVDVVEKLITTSTDATERETWMRQLIDTVSVAVQSGSYPKGLERLKKFSSELGENDTSMAPYANYQILSTEYMRRQTPDADFAKVQEWYLEELTAFVDTYPESPEAGQALLQLALSKEFEGKQNAALEYYAKVVKAFAGMDSGEKAAGAVRRLQSEGRTIEFNGRTVKGEAFDLAKLVGRPVIIHYWATWCEACKQDMKLLRQLQAKYQYAGLTIVGVNVDATREDAAGYLKDNSAPWIHLYEDGGLESSSLAKQLGVQTLPMMLLLDSSGKVVSNNIYPASLDGELAKITKAAPKK